MFSIGIIGGFWYIFFRFFVVLVVYCFWDRFLGFLGLRRGVRFSLVFLLVYLNLVGKRKRGKGEEFFLKRFW